MLGKEKGDHMADVLLSLKHAVVHPHQVGDSPPPPPLMPSHHPLPPFHPPPPYSPSTYPPYTHTPTYMSLAPLVAPSPPPDPSITEPLLPPPVGSPHSGAPGDADLPPATTLGEAVTLPDTIGATSPPPPSLSTALSTQGALSFGAATLGSNSGAFGSSMGSLGGPLPSMGSSGYSSPISSSLGGSLGGPLLPPPPSMSPFSYQQGQVRW